MSKLGYRRSTHNGSKLIPLSLSASSFSTITPPTTSFSTFETLHKVHSNPQDLFIKPSPKDSRTIRRVNSASLLTNVHLRPRTPSISALPDSPSWVSSRDRKYSQDSTSSLLTASIDRRRRDSESGLLVSASRSTSSIPTSASLSRCLQKDPRFPDQPFTSVEVNINYEEEREEVSEELTLDESEVSWLSTSSTLRSAPPPPAQVSQKRLLSDQMTPFQYTGSLGPVKLSPTSNGSQRLYPPSTTKTREMRRPSSAGAETGVHRRSRDFKNTNDEALADAVRRIVTTSSSCSTPEDPDATITSTLTSKERKRTSVGSIALEFPDVPPRPTSARERTDSAAGSASYSGIRAHQRRPRTQEDHRQQLRFRRKPSLSSPIDSEFDGKKSATTPSPFGFATAPSTPPVISTRPGSTPQSGRSSIYGTPQSQSQSDDTSTPTSTISPPEQPQPVGIVAYSNLPPSAWKQPKVLDSSGIKSSKSARPRSIDIAAELGFSGLDFQESSEDVERLSKGEETSVKGKLDAPIQLKGRDSNLAERTSCNHSSNPIQVSTSASATSPVESISERAAKKMNQRFSYSLADSLEDEVRIKSPTRTGFKEEGRRDCSASKSPLLRSFSRPVSRGIENEEEVELDGENEAQAQLQGSTNGRVKLSENISQARPNSNSRFHQSDYDYFTSNHDRTSTFKPSDLSPSTTNSTLPSCFSANSHSNFNSPLTSPETESVPSSRKLGEEKRSRRAEKLPSSSSGILSRSNSTANSYSSKATASSSEGLLRLGRGRSKGKGKYPNGISNISGTVGEVESSRKSKKMGLKMFKKVFNMNVGGSGGENNIKTSLGFNCSDPRSSFAETLETSNGFVGLPKLNARSSSEFIFPIMRDNFSD